MRTLSIFTTYFKQGWTWMRWLRLGFGSLLLAQALTQSDMLAGGLGGLLLVQAFIGCAPCEGGVCRIQDKKPE